MTTVAFRSLVEKQRRAFSWRERSLWPGDDGRGPKCCGVDCSEDPCEEAIMATLFQYQIIGENQ